MLGAGEAVSPERLQSDAWLPLRSIAKLCEALPVRNVVGRDPCACSAGLDGFLVVSALAQNGK